VVGSNKEEEDIVDVLSGHLCRCTGYLGLKKALHELARTTEVSSHHSLTDNQQH
jgi:aerobic-type carbon monoxide dehydrogenase small subunit (CoxS/CutS family)